MAVQRMLGQRRAVILPLTPPITERAMALMESLTLSRGLQMGDALIAATALEHQLPLLTGNIRHFAAIDGLQTDAFRI